jgi:predicted RecB family nuclease
VGGRGHIVAYNATFETQRLDDLARWFPQYRTRVDEIKSRVWDLLPFVRRNVYHPHFRGSFSLKSVLPAFLPELTYKDMEVGNGEEAGAAWERMLAASTSAPEKARLKQAILAYCRQDTWALVALVPWAETNS